MTALEIILIIIGIIFIVGSFMISEKFTATSEQLKAAIDENELKKVIDAQVRNMEDDIAVMVEDTAKDALKVSKREMEKLSNEKIMAVDDFSKTVMENIEKCHSEVMFLYGMLNDKNKETKDTAELITKANKSINKKIEEANLVVGRLNEQIAEINEFIRKQQEMTEQMNDSAIAIETLEEQLDNIEKMAVQFSADIKVAEEQFKNNVTETNVDSEDEYSLENNSLEEDFCRESDMENDNLENTCESDTFVSIEAGNILNDEEEEELSKILSAPAEEKIEENSNEKILEMSRNGMQPLDIAKQLGLGVGEVQLVIDLFEGGR